MFFLYALKQWADTTSEVFGLPKWVSYILCWVVFLLLGLTIEKLLE